MRRGSNVSRPCLQLMVQRNMAFLAFSLLPLSRAWEIGIQRCAWGLISAPEILLGTLPIPSLSSLLMTAG